MTPWEENKYTLLMAIIYYRLGGIEFFTTEL